MAVIKSKRKPSDMDFLYNARQLQIHSIRKCVNFPKRYTFYISQPIANCATRIHENVKLGNSIYPTNQHEVQMRRDYFLKANAELYNLVSLIEVANELFGPDIGSLQYWMDLINDEIRLVKAVMKSDRERYKNIP